MAVKRVKITQVTFRSMVMVGKFQTVHIEASAQVGAGESPSEVLAGVKQFVAAELRRARDGVRQKPVPVQGKFTDMLQTSEDTWERGRTRF